MTGRENAVAGIVAAEISQELDEDYVEMWKLPRLIHAEWPGATGPEVQAVAEIVLTKLVEGGARLGDVDWQAEQFRPWPPVGAVGRAMDAWVRLGREPNMGDIGWLDKPATDAPP